MNGCIESTSVAAQFSGGQVGEGWYYRWLDRYSDQLSTRKCKPFEADRARWCTASNLEAHYNVLEATALEHKFAVRNSDFDPSTPCSQKILWVGNKLPRVMSWDESRVTLDMVEVDGNLRTLCLRGPGDEGKTLAHKGGPSATVVGGSTAAGDSLPCHLIFSSKLMQPGWTLNMPVSTLIDTSVNPPKPFPTTFHCNETGTMEHTTGCVRYFEQNVFPTYAAVDQPVCPVDPILAVTNGHGSHLSFEFLEFCRRKGIILVLRTPHSTNVSQGEDTVKFPCFKTGYRKRKHEVLYQKILTGVYRLSLHDLGNIIKGPWEEAFSRDKNHKAWASIGVVPFDRRVMWDLRAKETRRAAASLKVDLDPKVLNVHCMLAPREVQNEGVEEEDTVRRTRVTSAQVFASGPATSNTFFALVKENRAKVEAERLEAETRRQHRDEEASRKHTAACILAVNLVPTLTAAPMVAKLSVPALASILLLLKLPPLKGKSNMVLAVTRALKLDTAGGPQPDLPVPVTQSSSHACNSTTPPSFPPYAPLQPELLFPSPSYTFNPYATPSFFPPSGPLQPELPFPYPSATVNPYSYAPNPPVPQFPPPLTLPTDCAHT